MKKYLLAIAILLNMSLPVYASNFPTNLEGKYDCNSVEVGTNENFTGVITMKKTGQTYSINSIYNDGSTYVGTGIYDQSKHIFSLVFVNPKKSEETGVVLADVKENSDMTSTWTYLHKTSVAYGTCNKRRLADHKVL